MDSVVDTQKKIEMMIANAQFSIDIVSPMNREDKKGSFGTIATIEELEDELFLNPENLEVTKQVNIELSSIMKGCLLHH